MTPFRIVVSWLALLFLGWRVISDSYNPGANWDLGLTVGNSLWGSPLWAFLPGILIAMPWIRNLKIFQKWHWMADPVDETRAEYLNVAGRWIFVVLAVLAPAFISGFDSFSSLFSSVTLGIFLVCCLAPELAWFASSGFTGFIDAVFFPGGRETRPPYTLKLARFYVENQRWEAAEAEYARVLSFHPDQAEAWRERLTLAFRRLGTADPGPEEVLAMAIKALQAPADREALHHYFVGGERS